MLRQVGNCPEGVYITPTTNLEEWQGVIFVRKGYYKGGIFRFRINFPSSYPLRAPSIIFAKGSLIHPLIDPKDDHLALASGFPSWNPKESNITRILYFIKGIFKTYQLNKLNDGLAINGEAWRMFHSNRTVFAKLASQCANISASTINTYTQPSKGSINTVDLANTPSTEFTPHNLGLNFRQLSKEEMEAIRQTLFEQEK